MGLLLLILATVNLITEGIVLSVLWSWFMVTTFGLPVISIPMAIGISIIMSLLTHRIRNEDIENVIGDPDHKIALTRILFQFLTLVLLLGMGWVVHLFVPV